MTRKDELNHYLKELQLTWPRQHYEALSEQALKEHWTPTDYLARLLEGECHRRRVSLSSMNVEWSIMWSGRRNGP